MCTISDLFQRTCRHAFLMALLFASLASGLSAQVTVTTIVAPPYSPVLSDYAQYEGQIIIRLQNTSPQNLRVKLGATLSNSDMNIFVATRPEANLALFELAAFETRILRSDEIREIFHENDFQISGFDVSDVERDRVLPEGDYQLCLRAYNYDQPGFSEPLSLPEPSGCSNPIIIRYLEPPQILWINEQKCDGHVATQPNPQVVIK